MARPIDTERLNKIVSYVLTNGKATIGELADLFHVTTETIRKDVAELHDKNVLHKGHGIVMPSSSYLENPFARKQSDNAEAKNLIAVFAESLIPKNSVIFLDSGTTTLQLANVLNMRGDLTIVTNSMMAGQALANSANQLLVTGGELRRNSYSYVGAWAQRAVQQINVDIAFLGCDGFHSDGPSIRSYRELSVKETIAKQADKSLLLADSSKFAQQGLYCFCSFDDIDMIISERTLTEEVKKRLPEKIEVIAP